MGMGDRSALRLRRTCSKGLARRPGPTRVSGIKTDYSRDLVKWLKADLAELAGGRGGRAALILIAAHLALPLFAYALWALGLLPVFDDLRWLPTAIVSIYGAVIFVGLFLRFGAWGTARSFFRDYGEEYMDTFSPRVGLGLGWLRWFMQIVAAFIIIPALAMSWGNVRWWQISGTEVLAALPARAAEIPVPGSWKLEDTDTSQTGVLELPFQEHVDGPAPQGYVKRTYIVPDSYTFDELKGWLQGPLWENDGDGDAFGAIKLQDCLSESTRCRAQVVPASGDKPEYFIRAAYHDSQTGHAPTRVDVRLNYHQYVEPDWEVSQETVDRARMIPIPADWTRSSVVDGTTNNGEKFTQFYRAPDSFTHEDLKAWLNGPTWTEPATGEPFGRIQVDDCRIVGADSDEYLCSVTVGGDNTSSGTAGGPIETLTASFDPDHTVQVGLSRNG